MKKSLLVLIFIALFTLHLKNAYAQSSNDPCASAISLTSSTTCNYTYVTVVGATQSIAAISCGGTGTADDDVWYKFVAQATSHTIKVQGYGSYDAVIDVRSGSCMGTNIACMDATLDAGLETLVVPGLTIGSTYLIRVYHYGTGDGGGLFDICVTHTAPSGPPNDFCDNNFIISLTSSLSCTPQNGSTLGATQTMAGTCTGTGDDDVWYRFVAQSNTHTVKVQGYGGFDAVIDIRNAPACTANNMQCVDVNGANGLETANLTSLVIGATYVVRVYHFDPGNGGGSFDICITHTAPSGPPNDICSDAISLSSSLSCSYVTGSTLNATQSITGTCTGTGDDDVWYSFVAQATSHTVKVQGAGAFDAVIDIRSNSSCSGTNIMCVDASGAAGLETANLTSLTIGTTYLVRVFHYGAGAGGGSFQICVTHTPPAGPSNDICSNLISLSSALTCNYTSGSTTGATQSVTGNCTGSGDDDVWYSFTAVATAHTVKVQGGTGFDAVIDLRSNSSCAGTNISCTDASGDAGLETANLTGLTVGSTYLVRVYNFGPGAGGGSFQICVTHTVPAAPVNDLCSAVISLTSALNCTYTSGSTTGGTQSIPGTCVGNGDDDVWYSFTAVATSHTVKVQGGTGFDAVIDVRAGTSCSGTNLTCSDISGSAGLETANLTGLTVGSLYLVRVYHFGAGAGTGSFQICVTHTAPGCTYAIAPTSLSFTSAAGTGTVNVTSQSGCNWTATSNDSWITVTSGSTGTANGSVTYSVSANTGTAQRTGTITIAGLTHTVAQSGNTTCTFTIAPLNQSLPNTAGTGTVTVTAAAGCSWAATSNDAWITVTTGSTGSGNGTVTYSITANTGTTQRIGTITIAGQIHTVTQAGTTPCSFTISPLTLSYASSGGLGSVNVTAAVGCTWTATSNNPWITITSGSTGSGNGAVNYTVAANTGTTQLTGTITVAGQTHTVTESGINCTYAIAPTALSFTSIAGTGTVNVTTAIGCSWTATSNDAWITVTSGSTGSGNGSVSYSVSANTGTTQRLGSISIGGQTHNVVQNGVSACTYTIAPLTQSYTSAGGTGAVAVTSANGCSWTAISNDSWIFISSGNTGSGNGSVNLTVSASTSTAQRTGTITIAGQIHTITQTGVICPATPVMQSVGCALAANQTSNASYQWYISGTPIVGATTQFYTANQPGYYSIYVTDNTNGCIVGSQPAYVSCSGVGIEELSLADGIQIYPNPSSGSFNIRSSTIFPEGKVNISIINMVGMEIYSTVVIPVNGEIKLTVDNVNPAKGVYTVLFRSGQTKIIKRVVIQ
ncbi:MAG: BACON domain-containing carbohydrate-binding protein [Bacteroidota bacterium]